ncbi:MAG: RHS repeat-associated core domain-containing protein, partial [Candidatus Udaeobacter sp.]
LQTKTLKAIAFKNGMTNSNIKSADYSFERDCGQRPGNPNKKETTVDDLLSLPEGMDPESLQTADRTVTYSYDNAGNRTTVNDSVNGNRNYTPNNLNQYTALTGTTITNGPEHEIASYGSSNYTYLNDEHLIEVTNSIGNNDYRLVYDALGRCVKRTVNGLTKYYIYAGEKPILEYNPSAQIIGRNVYGKGIDEILMRTDYTFSPAVTLYYQQDHEGSVTHLTSTSGNILEKYRYDVYGAPTIYPPAPGATPIPVSAYSNRFMFTGRDYSNMFGFYEYRARAYHPGLGRFMSEDPKLFDAGDYNLFRYCHNDPIDFTDPMGLQDTVATTSQLLGEIKESQKQLAQLQAAKHGKEMFGGGAAEIGAMNHAIGQIQRGLTSALKYADKMTGGPEYRGLLQSYHAWVANNRAAAPGFAQAVLRAVDETGGIGMGLPAGAITTAASVTAAGEGTQVFRVFGNEAKGLGQYYTTVNPAAVANYRKTAGLFPGNSGQFVLQGTLKNTEGVILSRAAAGPGGIGGGLPQVFVPSPQTQINILRVSGVNPEF